MHAFQTAMDTSSNRKGRGCGNSVRAGKRTSEERGRGGGMVARRGFGRRAKGVGGCKVQSIARLPSLGSYSTPIEERYRHDRRAVTIADSLVRTGFELNRAIARAKCPLGNFSTCPSTNAASITGSWWGV